MLAANSRGHRIILWGFVYVCLDSTVKSEMENEKTHHFSCLF